VGGLSQMKLTSFEKTVTFCDDPLVKTIVKSAKYLVDNMPSHLFIICGAVYAFGISRNPIKALSIPVNHNECVFLRTSSSFRVSRYQIVLSTQDFFFTGRCPISTQSCMSLHSIQPLSTPKNRESCQNPFIKG
jgi:hypothetical protein